MNLRGFSGNMIVLLQVIPMNYLDARECSVRISKLLKEIDLLERMISDNYGNLSDIEVNQIENEIIHKYNELHNIERSRK